MSARISGVQGASKKAKMPAPVRNWRTVSKSRLAWPGLASEPVKAGLELGGQYPLAQELVDPAADPAPGCCERITSSRAMTPSNPTVISVSISRVASLLLCSTRS